MAQPLAKVRSRKDGSAVPLDETDKKLLNLMQGSFELRPDPFKCVAQLAGISEQETMERVQYLLDKRIIREITPIFDTRALGYSSMPAFSATPLNGSGRRSNDPCMRFRSFLSVSSSGTAEPSLRDRTLDRATG